MAVATPPPWSLRDLFCVLYLVVGGVAAVVLHQRIMRAAGPRRLGQAAAYIVGGLCAGAGLGLFLGLLRDGWSWSRRTDQWGQLPLPTAITTGVVVGVTLSLVMFLLTAWRGGNPVFPPETIEIILADEARASPRARARTARRLVRRARRSGMPLPPELDAYVARNHAPRHERRPR